MAGFRELLFTLVAVTVINVTDGLWCLSCQDVASPDVCFTVEFCGEHEVCSAELNVSPNGFLSWDLGCRDSLQCTFPPPNNVTDVRIPTTPPVVLGRAAAHTPVCQECCTTDLCAIGTCGSVALPGRPDRGPICFSCDFQLSPVECDTYKVCSRDEHCLLKIDVGDKFTSGCASEVECVKNYNFFKSILVGRRDTDEPIHNIGAAVDSCVSKCCDSDFCNNDCNGTQVITPTTTLDPYTTTDEVPLYTKPSEPTVTRAPTAPTTVGSTVRSTTPDPVTTKMTTQITTQSTTKITTPSVAGPCGSNPCIVGQCEAMGPFYHCICPDGYTGINCEIAPRPCERNPCHHGNCTANGSEYICQCEYGYYGKQCEQHIEACFSNPCVHGTCTSFGDFFSCQCPTGYSGLTCQIPPSACASNPCMHGTCIDHGTKYTCNCPADYSGISCEIERNPCWSNPCIHGTCSRLGASYVCNCTDGYTGSNCEHFPDACADKPCVHGTCHTYMDNYSCECDPGFSGINCEKVPNPCVSNPCSHGTCVQNDTSFYCNCDTGYTGATCQTVVGQCDLRPCYNNGVCIGDTTTFRCDCVDGFTGDICEIPRADPCDTNPCIHGTCSSNGTTFTCECEPGYINATCNEAYCRKNVLFMVDDSGSVGQFNFNSTLYMLASVLQQLNLGGDGTDTAFETFSTQPQITWDFATHPDLRSALDALEKVIFFGGQTNFEPALTLAAQMFNSARPDAGNVVVLVSDGGEINHNQQAFLHHDLLKNLSHDIITIVVEETKGNSVDINTMKDVATDNQHFLPVDSYQNLTRVVNDAVRLICN